MSSEDRQYYAIWSALKKLPPKDAECKGVSITAPRVLHKRIIKAVKKEKWMDLGWKMTIEPQVAELSFIRNNGIVTFFLTRKVYDGRMKSFSVESF